MADFDKKRLRERHERFRTDAVSHPLFCGKCSTYGVYGCEVGRYLWLTWKRMEALALGVSDESKDD